MKTVAEVTASNTPYKLKCLLTNVFLSDANPFFETVAISQKIERGIDFPDREAAAQAQKWMKAIYPSFDWQPVEVA